MNFQSVHLSAGLYLVATPIGTARDITLRALDILASADVLAAEDTRTLRKLMEIHGIPLGGRSVIAYHDHSKAADRARLLAHARDGKSVAYTSEAGTPLVADPGFVLVAEARKAGIPVTAAPGPSAVIAALSIAGLGTDQFHFAGFAPNAQTARRSFAAALRDLPATVVLYEAPGRLSACLDDLAAVMGETRQAAVCREITKKFEEVQRGTLAALAAHFKDNKPKGEIVVLIERAEKKTVDEADIRAALADAMQTMRLKDAATAVAGALGVPRREVYQLALRLKS